MKTEKTELLRRAVARSATAQAIEVFHYPACPGAKPMARNECFEAQNEEEEGTPARHGAHGRHVQADGTAFDAELTATTTRAFEAGKEQGIREGREMERAAQATARNEEQQRHKQQLAQLVEDFAAERDRYLEAVEHEVVKLALAVAARILRREAQMDPLLLTGAVRVALGQLAGATEVQLRVPSADRDLWVEAMAMLPKLTLKPAVLAGEGMRLGDCVIESKAGTVDLGVRSQLKEIERGFFDRTDAAPKEGVDPRGAMSSGSLA